MPMLKKVPPPTGELEGSLRRGAKPDELRRFASWVAKPGIVIHQGRLRMLFIDVERLKANAAARRLIVQALEALGRHDFDQAHRLAKEAIKADPACRALAGFVGNVVAVDDVEAYPGEPGSGPEPTGE